MGYGVWGMGYGWSQFNCITLQVVEVVGVDGIGFKFLA